MMISWSLDRLLRWCYNPITRFDAGCRSFPHLAESLFQV